MAGPICMKFSGKVWNDHGTTWLNFGSVWVNGSAGQRLICLLSPAIAQRTGVNKSVSFARWQQGRGLLCLAPQLVLIRRWSLICASSRNRPKLLCLFETMQLSLPWTSRLSAFTSLHCHMLLDPVIFNVSKPPYNHQTELTGFSPGSSLSSALFSFTVNPPSNLIILDYS